MKVMFIAPYPRYEAPSQRFRFEQQIEFLEANGLVCDVHSFWDLATWRILYKQGHTSQKLFGFIKGWLRRFSLLFRLHKYDVVFLHREAAPVGPPVIEWLITKVLRKKMVYDFDDAIWLPNVSHTNRFAAALKNHAKVKSICKWSWKVSCGNEFLAAFAKQFNVNVYVVPTTVDTDYYNSTDKPANSKLVIGWTGSQSTNAYVEKMEGVFKALSTTVDFELMLISNQPPALTHPYTFIKWNRDTEVKDLTRLDIGLMPLSDDDWSRGKCAFKLIQYGALRIPSIASPVGANKNVVLEGKTGLFATNDQEWLNALQQLAADKVLRIQMGEESRRHIVKNYSQNAMQTKYMALFTEST